jgi:hypothetical protein
MRNNNPGNIRRSKEKWKGMAEEQTDTAFVQFKSIEYGYRALFVIIRNYVTKHNCKTVRHIITRWAPPSENDTEAYIADVCSYTGMRSDQEVNFSSKTEMCKLAAGITHHENGVMPVYEDVMKGWKLYEEE